MEGFKGFAPIVSSVEDYQIQENDVFICAKFFNTPGHSPASICFLIETNLFTGDTLLFNQKTILKVPKGSRKDLEESINFLSSLKGYCLRVYPGHGDDFEMDSYDLGKAL